MAGTYTLGVLTDEVSPRLEDGLRFAAESGLSTVDIRSIGGANFLSLTLDEQKRAARQIRDAGLTVGTLATPLLKWSAPGHTARDMGDQFGFDAGGRSPADLYRDAFAAADLLGCRNLRVFSYLACDGFSLSILDREYEALLRLAESHDAVIHVENEHVCNISSVADLIAAMSRWRHPRLRALLDIPNAWRAGQHPDLAEIAAIMPFVTQTHMKDYSHAQGRFVALGTGDIPFADMLPVVLKAAAGRSIAFVVETHVPNDQPSATQKSLEALRAMLAAASHQASATDPRG